MTIAPAKRSGDTQIRVVPARPVEAAPTISSVSWIRPGRTLMVASTGGHLEELYRLRQRFLPDLEDVEWATFDTAQSRSLLADEIVHFVPFVKPKDLRGTWHSSTEAARLLGGGRFARVISTGAAVAVPFLGHARASGLAAHYIESAARSAGLSMSGSMARSIPGVRLYGQYPGWTSGRCQFRGSVFDGFAAGPTEPRACVDKVVVTLGTQPGFGFRRALEALTRVLPEVVTPSASILWQVGSTDTTGLPIKAVDVVPADDLNQAVAEADLVISHSGVGTALMVLEHGKCPVLLPRRRRFREHTDDHQTLVADELARRGLAVRADPDALTAEDLLAAASMTASGVAEPPPFLLQPD
jgi:UDP-N-acetylglucosamine--N-acetylmuramyl-(pentapeptide) pyrophosphoryl-undecaprenol N-acetylglucosamine transferase